MIVWNSNSTAAWNLWKLDGTELIHNLCMKVWLAKWQMTAWQNDSMNLWQYRSMKEKQKSNSCYLGSNNAISTIVVWSIQVHRATFTLGTTSLLPCKIVYTYMMYGCTLPTVSLYLLVRPWSLWRISLLCKSSHDSDRQWSTRHLEPENSPSPQHKPPNGNREINVTVNVCARHAINPLPYFSRLGVRCPAPVYVCCVLYVLCVLLRLGFWVSFFSFRCFLASVLYTFLCTCTYSYRGSVLVVTKECFDSEQTEEEH